MGEEIPEDYVSYFTKFLDNLVNRFPERLYRYITPRESPYWVAFDGFHLGRSYMKKVSMTLPPILYTWALASWRLRLGWLELTGDFYRWAKAVPYTHEIDPLTKDPLYVYEFEMAVYAQDYRRKVEYERPWLIEEAKVVEQLIVPIDHVRQAKLLPEALEAGLNEKDYFKLKILPEYVHGRPYRQSPYRLMPRDLLVQQLSIVTILKMDNKMKAATSYVWDRYWDGKGMIAYPPDYEKALRLYRVRGFWTSYDLGDIEHTCTYSYVPVEVCWEVADDVAEEIQSIYGFFDVTIRYTGAKKPTEPTVEPSLVSRHALELYRVFPQFFGTPSEAEHFLKWWHGTYEDALRYIKEFLENERLYRRVWLRYDPEVVEG